MTMCLLFPVGMLVMAVVDEKEHRLKQTLKISGLTHASWAGGWYATALLQVTGCHCRHRLHSPPLLTTSFLRCCSSFSSRCCVRAPPPRS